MKNENSLPAAGTKSIEDQRIYHDPGCPNETGLLIRSSQSIGWDENGVDIMEEFTYCPFCSFTTGLPDE